MASKLSILTSQMALLKKEIDKKKPSKDQNIQVNIGELNLPKLPFTQTTADLALHLNSSISLDDSDASQDQKQMIEDLLEEVSYLKKKNRKYKKQAKKLKDQNSKLKKCDKLSTKLGIIGEEIAKSRSESRKSSKKKSKAFGIDKKKISWKEPPTLENSTFIYTSSRKGEENS